VTAGGYQLRCKLAARLRPELPRRRSQTARTCAELTSLVRPLVPYRAVIELGRYTPRRGLDPQRHRPHADARQRVQTALRSIGADCFCPDLSLCISCASPRNRRPAYNLAAETMARGSRPSVGPGAHSAGQRRGVGTPLRLNGNEAELILASARGRRVRRILRPHERAVQLLSANII
jgi:hypothetical protein